MKLQPSVEKTLKSDYEEKVMGHYTKVAQEAGLSPRCTMEDEYIRAGETRAILSLVDRVAAGVSARVRVLDVGCGNGYTLRTLAEHARDAGLAERLELLGIEKNPDLRGLAQKMNEGMPVAVCGGDIFRAETLTVGAGSVDICISQRVIINLMDPADQKAALKNLARIVRPGGYLLFIECFQSSMDNLNAARREFNLEPNAPAVHNLYLTEDFFALPEIEEAAPEGWNIPANLFSTHYYIQRVLQNAVRGNVIDRNSNFVRFFSAALPEAVGDYSPIRIHCFRKVAD